MDIHSVLSEMKQAEEQTDSRTAYIRPYAFVSRTSRKEHMRREVEKCIHEVK
jgi:hypothetical protein